MKFITQDSPNFSADIAPLLHRSAFSQDIDQAVKAIISDVRENGDDAIIRYMRRWHGVIIGKVTAEDIKIKIGCVDERPEPTSMMVRGRDSKSGMPRDLLLTSTEIYEVLRRLARQIADEVVSVLEDTSPELVSDIAENGITLTGGSSQLYGMANLIQARTGIPCTVADDPDSCVVYGCGKSLSWINHMSEGPINIARKRAMRQQ